MTHGARRARHSWKPSPLGWILLVAVVVLAVLTVVAPSTPVFLALAVLLLFGGLSLTARYPAGNARFNAPFRAADLGEENEQEYRRQRDLD